VWLRHLQERYGRDRPLETENATAALGAVGALGFLGLLAVFLLPRSQRSPQTLALAQLNLAAFLLATIAGFGTLINLVFAQFRCYNRMSMFIACFALLFVAGCIDTAWNRFSSRRIFVLLTVAALVVFGVWDQTPTNIRPNDEGVASRWDNDAAFVRDVEGRLPPASRVFELPIARFQETPEKDGLPDYLSAIGYLHSEKLEWSYGAMLGRPDADAQTALGERLENDATMDGALAELKSAGFRVLWIDWRGYSAEKRKALRPLLVRRLGEPFAVHSLGGPECYMLVKG